MSNFKTYKIFSQSIEVSLPFEYMRTLSNGEQLGALITSEYPNEQGMNQEEIQEYIKNNHVEPTEE